MRTNSMYSADRRTHLKIIVVGLLCATVVAAVGIFANIHDVDLGTAPLVKKRASPPPSAASCRPSGTARPRAGHPALSSLRTNGTRWPGQPGHDV